MTTKRAYKLQEFVAHSSTVNCLKIGRKSSRVLVTGGEDHKVNLWAIGKPNAILVRISPFFLHNLSVQTNLAPHFHING
jgi:WD40 repeat protein